MTTPTYPKLTEKMIRDAWERAAESMKKSMSDKQQFVVYVPMNERRMLDKLNRDIFFEENVYLNIIKDL